MVIQIHYGDFEVYLKVHRGAIYLTIFFNFVLLFYLTFLALLTWSAVDVVRPALIKSL